MGEIMMWMNVNDLDDVRDIHTVDAETCDCNGQKCEHDVGMCPALDGESAPFVIVKIEVEHHHSMLGSLVQVGRYLQGQNVAAVVTIKVQPRGMQGNFAGVAVVWVC